MFRFEFTIKGGDIELMESFLNIFKLFVQAVGLEMAGGVTWEADDGEETKTVS